MQYEELFHMKEGQRLHPIPSSLIDIYTTDAYHPAMNNRQISVRKQCSFQSYGLLTFGPICSIVPLRRPYWIYKSTKSHSALD